LNHVPDINRQPARLARSELMFQSVCFEQRLTNLKYTEHGLDDAAARTQLAREQDRNFIHQDRTEQVIEWIPEIYHSMRYEYKRTWRIQENLEEIENSSHCLARCLFTKAPVLGVGSSTQARAERLLAQPARHPQSGSLVRTSSCKAGSNLSKRFTNLLAERI